MTMLVCPITIYPITICRQGWFLLPALVLFFWPAIALADCDQHFDQANSALKKSRFHSSRGHQLKQRIAEAFQGEEERFIQQSHRTYKLYDYEMAIYNFKQAIQAYQTATQQYRLIQTSDTCEKALKNTVTRLLTSVHTSHNQARQHRNYLLCQYAIDKSKKLLLQSLDAEKQQDFQQAQQHAQAIRDLSVEGMGKQSTCSAKQIQQTKKLYEQAWDVTAKTNKPLAKQQYCQRQMNHIALIFKDADIEQANNHHQNAAQLRHSARQQISDLLNSQACPDHDEAWLKTKFAEAEQ